MFVAEGDAADGWAAAAVRVFAMLYKLSDHVRVLRGLFSILL